MNEQGNTKKENLGIVQLDFSSSTSFKATITGFIIISVT